MNIRNLAVSCLALVMVGTTVPATLWAQSEKTTWDDLHLVKSNHSSRLYLLPGADFKPYTKIMIDPVEVDFRKNWIRDYNRSAGSISRHIREDDATKALEKIRSGTAEVFAEEYQKAGWQVAQSPGPDVLRLRMGVIDVVVNSPDIKSSNRSYAASWEAGEATLFVEARDSASGQILGRVLDRRLAGDNQPYLRNSVTNQADFKILFRKWAKDSLEGLARLKSGATVNIAKK